MTNIIISGCRIVCLMLSLLVVAGCEKKSGDRPNDSQAASSSAPASLGTHVDDSIITTKIKAELLKDDRIKSLDISVATAQGEVTLSGQVENSRQIEICTDLARGVQGVKQVNSQLTIKQSAYSDQSVTESVQAALQGDADLKQLAILVSTKDGEVQLSGLVESQAQIRRSIAVAQRVPGVKTVTDRMKVR